VSHLVHMVAVGAEAAAMTGSSFAMGAVGWPTVKTVAFRTELGCIEVFVR
jgi:hypothetical protein